jgi:hypothetical protein
MNANKRQYFTACASGVRSQHSRQNYSTAQRSLAYQFEREGGGAALDTSLFV